MPYCSTCKGHYFDNPIFNLGGRPHVCAPQYLVRGEDDHPTDARTVFAMSAAAAAVAYIEHIDDADSADFTEHAVVTVTRRPDDDDAEADWSTLEWDAFDVYGELIRNYTASPVQATE